MPCPALAQSLFVNTLPFNFVSPAVATRMLASGIRGVFARFVKFEMEGAAVLEWRARGATEHRKNRKKPAPRPAAEMGPFSVGRVLGGWVPGSRAATHDGWG